MQTKEFYLPGWKVSQPCLSNDHTLESNRVQVPPELNITCGSTTSSTQIWGPLIWFEPLSSSTRQKYTLSGIFWNRIYWQRNWHFLWFHWETKWSLQVLEDEFHPFREVWQNDSFSGTAFVLLFLKDLGSYCSALLITSGWHRFVLSKKRVAKSSL